MKNFSLNIKSVGLILIAIILLSEYIVLPWFTWVEETKQEIDSQSTTLLKQERLIRKAELLEEQREILATDFTAKLSGWVIVSEKQDSAVIWLKEVESLLDKYDVKVNRKSPLREVEINKEFAVYAGRINIKGDYSEVLNFLEKLENDKVGNRIRQLRLNSNKVNPTIVTADIEFLKVFKRS
jgi:hypothetical protein